MRGCSASAASRCGRAPSTSHAASGHRTGAAALRRGACASALATGATTCPRDFLVSSPPPMTGAMTMTAAARRRRRRRVASLGNVKFGGEQQQQKQKQRAPLVRCVVTAAEVDNTNSGAPAEAELADLAPRPVLPGLEAAPTRPRDAPARENGRGNGNRGNGDRRGGRSRSPSPRASGGPPRNGNGRGDRPKNIAVPPPSTPRRRAPSPMRDMTKAASAAPAPATTTRDTRNRAPAPAKHGQKTTSTNGGGSSAANANKRQMSKKMKKLDESERRAIADAERESRFMQRRNKAATGVVTPEMKRKAREERKKRRAEQNAARAAEAPGQVDILEVGPDGLLIEELARLLAIAPTQVVGSLFLRHGVMTTVNQTIDANLVTKVCEEYDVDVIELSEDEAKAAADAREREAREAARPEEKEEDLEARAPVVCIMGHVDHGKTSLLDYMKKSAIADGEAGGITQGIGAYRVPVPGAGAAEDEQAVVFLDTPGHEAFSEMRRRGAKMTDIALLVVAADDGVQETTKQAYKFASSNGVPIVVALTKTDKPGAQPDRVRQELADLGLLCEDWGGQTPTVAISSKTGENVGTMLETLMLVAELENLRANPRRAAEGTVIEAALTKGRGCVATVLVQVGTLRVGDFVRMGAAHGRVRSLVDDRGRRLKLAGPSTPVQVSGLSAIPLAGDPVAVCKTAKAAEALAKTSPQKESMVGDLNWARQDNTGGDLQIINLMIRADNAGALEAVRTSLAQIPQEKVALRFVNAGNGDVSVSDVDLASTSGSTIIGFNVNVLTAAAAKAKEADVTVLNFDVIYALIDNVREQMLSLIDATEELEYMGSASVKAIFQSGRGGKVAGCIVTDGKIESGCVAKVFRKQPGSKKAEEVVPRDSVGSIRRVKDVVSSVSEGTECGIGLKGFSGFEEGDIIKAYEAVTVPPSLEF